MERKNIAFQYGINRSPSAANDGELAECINLEVHNGELTPSVMPQVAFSLEEGDKLLFVHKSGNYKNYIVQRGTDLCWFSDEDKSKVNTIGQFTPTSIHAVGNTLVVLTSEHMEYILYKSGNYKPIGSKPPFCSISFGLHGGYDFRISSFTIEDSGAASTIDTSGFISGLEKYFDDGTIPEDVSFLHLKDRIETDEYVNPLESKFLQKMTECGMGLINDLISDKAKLGSFPYSFYLRYAYRMYDGSHYMHSAPVFMPVSTFGPILSPTYIEEKDANHTIGMELKMPSTSLNYRIIGFYDEEGNIVDNKSIIDWEDIVTGIDIFVSKPVYTHKQDGYIWGYTGKTDEMKNSLAFTGKNNVISSDNQEILFKNIHRNNTYSDISIKPDIIFTVEKDEDYLSKLKDTSLFYKVSEMNGVGFLSASSHISTRLSLKIKDDALSNLEQQELLEDDYDSHNEIIPSFAHVYNGRLNISGIRTKIFSGFPMESMVPYTYVPESSNHFWYTVTNLELEGREVAVVSKSNIHLHEKPAFIYYPNAKVNSFTLNRYNGETGDPGLNMMAYYTATFVAETHKMLNGSFYLSPTLGIGDTYTLTTSSGSPQPSGDPYISYPNKVYTSEVNNPFFFPLSGRNSIGTGDIIAITSNTKAISPGQFGEYPLIVFSTDGVWAMQTGEEGLYFSVHPISKDICTNPNVLQTDGPVLFATDNGLHSIVTDTVANISKAIKGKPESVIIPEVDATFSALYSAATDTLTLTDFIRDALFAYDYANNRAVMYNPAKGYAYSYSLESGMFSKLVLLKGESPVKMEGIVRAYPEIYMQAGTDIYTFVPDKDNTTGTTQGILVTRAMAFADPLAMKVINDVRLIYHRSTPESKCLYAMYVSNDGYNWVMRRSLRGHSYKYFRFVIFTDLADTDALQGMSVMFDYRRTNKLR